MALLLISADLEELIGLSDTLHVIYSGRLVAKLDPNHVTPEELGSYMTGARRAGGGEAAGDDAGTGVVTPPTGDEGDQADTPGSDASLASKERPADVPPPLEGPPETREAGP